MPERLVYAVEMNWKLLDMGSCYRQLTPPNTISITYESEKYTEIIKQMYDVSKISKSLGHNHYPVDTYIEMAKKQISWRDLKLTYKDALRDSITTCLNILTSRAYDKGKYELLERSMLGINGYVYGNKFMQLIFGFVL
jgi:hypothetical protein